MYISPLISLDIALIYMLESAINQISKRQIQS
jgi:hypothetical protein